MNTWTRRKFLTTSLLTGGAALLARSRLTATVAPAGSPNGDVRIAIVGVKGKGNDHIKQFGKLAGVRIVALCDVDRQVLSNRAREVEPQHGKVAQYVDYRRVLDDPSVDAVVIVTPNHWHALMTVWGCQAGKDVYCEKPISHNVWEGRRVVEAAQHYNRVVVTGTQSRSDEALQEAFAEIRAGKYGRIKWARGLCYKLRESIGRTSGPQPVPPHIDYDLWSGPAALVPPRRKSVHYDWHWFWNYGGGDIANQGIHEMDMCRWALGESGFPPTVMAIGGRFGYDDDAETPNTQVAVFGYEAAPLIFEVRGLPRAAGVKAMDAYRGIRVGLVVQCEHGYFAGGAGGGGFYDNAGKKIRQLDSGGGGAHQGGFIAAVRSRKPSDNPAPIEGGHISSTLCHLGNISYRLGTNAPSAAISEAVRSREATKDSWARTLAHLEANGVATPTVPSVLGPTLELVPGKEQFVSAEKCDSGFWANTMLRRDYRPPFVVPEKV